MDFETEYLNDKQRKDLKEFISDKSKPEVYIEEDCSGAKDYHFEVLPTGIGDCVHIVCGGKRLWLDDGLVP